jgi:glyoxylase-like metal-dependent hydrolase (beta-lactamase superfamily II)
VLPVMWAGPTENWLAALDRILALDARVVVPGHGPVSGPDEVRVVREHLAWVQQEAEPRLSAGRSVRETAQELLESGGFRASPWGDWDQPERIVITIATIDRHRRDAAGPVGARERAQIFADVAAVSVM